MTCKDLKSIGVGDVGYIPCSGSSMGTLNLIEFSCLIIWFTFSVFESPLDWSVQYSEKEAHEYYELTLGGSGFSLYDPNCNNIFLSLCSIIFEIFVCSNFPGGWVISNFHWSGIVISSLFNFFGVYVVVGSSLLWKDKIDVSPLSSCNKHLGLN